LVTKYYSLKNFMSELFSTRLASDIKSLILQLRGQNFAIVSCDFFSICCYLFFWNNLNIFFFLLFRIDRSFIKKEIKKHLDKNCNQINVDHCFELFFTPYNLTYVYETCHERRMDQKTDLPENEKLKICECLTS
jgi:hypothetical protein